MNETKKTKSALLPKDLLSDMQSITILGGKDGSADPQNTNVFYCPTNINCPPPCASPHQQLGCDGKS